MPSEPKPEPEDGDKASKKPEKKPRKSELKSNLAERKAGTSRSHNRDGRPDFRLPFSCGDSWELTTYSGHDPAHKKIDFFNMNGSTAGQSVRASAPGTVVKMVDPGGVKINHGNGWYTLSLHMKNIKVDPGEDVEAGQKIGRVGSVGTGVAHLHYEQLYDSNSDGYAATSEMKVSKFNGDRFRLEPGSDPPVVKSSNDCG